MIGEISEDQVVTTLQEELERLRPDLQTQKEENFELKTTIQKLEKSLKTQRKISIAQGAQAQPVPVIAADPKKDEKIMELELKNTGLEDNLKEL